MKAYACTKCGQKGNEKPGFSRQALPEAVGTLDGMIPVDSFKCNSCGTGFVVPKGSIQVRKPQQAQNRRARHAG